MCNNANLIDSAIHMSKKYICAADYTPRHLLEGRS